MANYTSINGVAVNTEVTADLTAHSWSSESIDLEIGRYADPTTLDGCESVRSGLGNGTVDGYEGTADGSVERREAGVIVNGGGGSYKVADPQDYGRLRMSAEAQPTTRAAAPVVVAAPVGATTKVEPTPPTAGAATASAATAEVKNSSAPQLIEMMKNGTLPEAIMSDPAAMLALQQKVQEYQRAMQMITEMLKMQHEMLMNIIRNLK